MADSWLELATSSGCGTQDISKLGHGMQWVEAMCTLGMLKKCEFEKEGFRVSQFRVIFICTPSR